MDWIWWVIVGGILTIGWLWLSYRVTAKRLILKRGQVAEVGNVEGDDGEWHFDRAHTRRPSV